MASPRKRGPAEPKEINTRKNFDKRTIRKMYSAPFESAISKEMGRRSEEGGDRAVLQYSSQDVQVFCRKRPFSRAELEMKEFDVLRVGPGACCFADLGCRATACIAALRTTVSGPRPPNLP